MRTAALLLHLWFCLVCHPALAAVAHSGANDTDPAETLNIQYLLETDHDLSLETVSHLPDRAWTPSTAAVVNLGYTADTVWFRARAKTAATKSERVYLEIDSPVLDRIELYVKVALPGQASAPWLAWTLGDHQPFAERPYNNRNFVVPIDLNPAETIEVVARVTTTSAMQFSLTVWPGAQFELQERRFLFANGAYTGLMAGLFLYNLLIFLVTREKLHLYYIGGVFAITAFVLSLNGLGYQFVWPNEVGWNARSYAVFLALATGFFVTFTIEFVLPGEARLLQFRRSERVLGVYAVIAVISCVLPHRVAITAVMALAMAGMIAALVLACVRAFAGYRHAQIYLVAFAGLMFGGVLLALNKFGLIERSLLAENAAQIGSSVEVLLMSLALANRLTQEQQSRAIAAELLQLNEALKASMRAEEERSRALLELKDHLRLDAEQRNRDKSKFLADAVHDLRQPLQAIGNALDPICAVIQVGRKSDAIVLVDLARRAADIMRAQLAAVLDLSRLESGLVEADCSDFDAVGLVHEVADQLRAFAREHRVMLDVKTPRGSLVFVHSDRHLLQRILLNLVGNGIKYHDPARHGSRYVSIDIRAGPSRVQVDISDNGIGIDNQFLANQAIFRPFFQVHNRHPEAGKGVGLGLSIVQAMVGLLPQHRLGVESVVGQGSTFAVELPPAAAPRFEVFSPASAEPGDAAGVGGKYVFLVEDDALVRQTTIALLAANAVLYEAWESIADLDAGLALTERAPDVLLSDYRLPDGKTAVDAIRSVRQCWGNVPVIVLSGQALDALTEPGLQDATLCRKPMAPADLLRTIARAAASATSGPGPAR